MTSPQQLLTRDQLAPKETGDRFVYSVKSEKSENVYRCDMVANGGAGWCSCWDFTTRRQPAIDRGEPWFTRATQCIHLRRVLVHIFSGLARSECTPPNKKDKPRAGETPHGSSAL